MGVPRVLDVCSRFVANFSGFPMRMQQSGTPLTLDRGQCWKHRDSVLAPLKAGLLDSIVYNHLHISPLFFLECSNMGVPALCHANRSQIAQTSIAKAIGQFFALLPFNLPSVFDAFDYFLL